MILSVEIPRVLARDGPDVFPGVERGRGPVGPDLPDPLHGDLHPARKLADRDLVGAHESADHVAAQPAGVVGNRRGASGIQWSSPHALTMETAGLVTAGPTG